MKIHEIFFLEKEPQIRHGDFRSRAHNEIK